MPVRRKLELVGSEFYVFVTPNRDKEAGATRSCGMTWRLNEMSRQEALTPSGRAHSCPGSPTPIRADRVLIATARTRSLVLATRDRAIIEYGNAGHVHVLEL